MKIRLATNQDKEQIQNVVFGVLAEYGLKNDPEGTDKDLNDVEANYIAPGGIFVVLENENNKIVGTGGLFYLRPGVCELRKMYLLKETRGKGVGKQMMDYLLAKARELSFKRIELETASVLVEAISLYTRYGFRPITCSDHLASRCDQAYALDLNPSSSDK
ncbi:MAG: GNAT family N-acetyltransferase [Acidobacteria bacterium]|nr:GNAT family N-acetyltransferase [Acidobacteriota bacterium]